MYKRAGFIAQLGDGVLVGVVAQPLDDLQSIVVWCCAFCASQKADWDADGCHCCHCNVAETIERPANQKQAAGH